MTATKVIDGRRIAQAIEDSVAREVRELTGAGIHPHLVTIRVGDDPATEVYVRNQKRLFKSLGIRYNHLQLDAETSEEGLLSHVRAFNDNPTITGIMLTRPVPDGIGLIRVQEAIKPEKDVEGVGPFNLGNLIYHRDGVGPCSALAVLEAIRSTGQKVEGARAVIVGHSDIVGKPVTLCLLRDLATTTTCHIATRDLKKETRRADILVVAVGKPGLITGDMVKDGAVVIDVGVTELATESAAGERKSHILGDVDFESVKDKAKWITPVPGGVGPITVAMLARNTVLCTRQQFE